VGYTLIGGVLDDLLIFDVLAWGSEKDDNLLCIPRLGCIWR
jgi:hypothetical protein